MSTLEEDSIKFLHEEEYNENIGVKKPWKIVISDDEHEVHLMTKLVLRTFELDGRKLEFYSAYTGNETIALLKENPDTAIVLLDVVMESDQAGLEVVKRIRHELGNKLIRIILRTGQPGQAPEDHVIRDYDINDYRSKTEITIQRLNTSIISALRAYSDLVQIENNKIALKNTLDVSRDIFKIDTLEEFAVKSIYGLEKIIGLNATLVFYNELLEEKFFSNNPRYDKNEIQRLYKNSIGNDSSLEFGEDNIVMWFRCHLGLESLIVIYHLKDRSNFNQQAVELFHSNLVVAYDNISLKLEMIETQREILFTLGDLIETRSKETANHVRRVSEYTYLLSLQLGLSEEYADMIRMASPMHDIGKIGIPDEVLNKPGKLTPEEFELIKTHTTIGYEVLKKSNQRILKLAADIALSHHERWDGLGYPKGLKGEEISISSRITAIVDVFDALIHKRIYKEAWELEDIVAFISENKGKMFDPTVVEVFFDNLDIIIDIKNKYPD